MAEETKAAVQGVNVPAKERKAEEIHERVPEGAEDMEHTLRRLMAEKEKKRAKNPGLYL